MTNTQRTWKQALFTPVRELLGMKPARRTWRQTVAEASLHADVKKVITDVIKRARLWRYESADVADELIAHFHDGLDAGRSVESLIKDFGDVKTAAKLIKRAKIRNRPLLWRAARRCVHAMLVMIVFYILSAVWLSFSEPTPSVDYIAVVNKTADAVPENDRAWPIYRKAFLESDTVRARTSISDDLYEATRDIHGTPLPSDPLWESKITPLLAKYQPFITAARLASDKPAMGLHMGRRDSYSREDSLAVFGTATPPGLDPAPHRTRAKQLMEESLIYVMLPSLGLFRNICTLLSYDMTDAAAAHDSARAVADYRAILGVARHTREVDFLICQLVSISEVAIANRTLATVLEKYPGLFTHDELTALAHLSGGAPAVCKISFESERAGFLDIVQRFYSDDGRGNGHMTRDGLSNLPYFDGERSADPLSPGNIARTSTAAALPLVVFATADRRELTEFGERHYNEFDAIAKLPMWEAIARREAMDHELIELGKNFAARWRLNLAFILLPALGATITTSHTAIACCEATTLAIALESYRQDRGQYPDALDALVPQYFPRTPLDHSTGKPLLYKIQDGKPLLYGRGLDGKDDGGVIEPPRPAGYYVAGPPQAGDWVLYPISAATP